MLTQDQLKKLNGMGLSQSQVNQVVSAAGGAEQPKTVGGFISNIGKSGVNLVGSTAEALLNPYQTVQNIISLAKDPKVIVDYYKNRYGKDLLETLYNDPVGVASDLSILMGGVGGVAKLSGAGKIAKTASTISKFADPIQLASMGVGKITGKLNIPGKLSKASDAVLTKGLGNPAKQAAIEAKYGVTAPQFIKKYGLYDRSPESLMKLEKSLGEQYGNVAKTSKATFDPSKIVSEIDAKIAELSSGNAGLSSANQQMVKELAKRRNQFVTTFSDKLEVPVGELASYRKLAIDPDIPMSEFGLSPKQAGKSAGTKKMRDILRSNINQSEPRLKELGIDISVAKGYKPVFGGSKSRGSNRQLFGIPKGTSTYGAILGGVPGFLAGAALEYATTNPRALGLYSRVMDKTSKLMSKPINVPSKVKTTAAGYYDVTRFGNAINRPNQASPQVTVPTPQASKKTTKLETPESPIESYTDYTSPKNAGLISYKSPKIKSNVFGGRKLTKSSAY